MTVARAVATRAVTRSPSIDSGVGNESARQVVLAMTVAGLIYGAAIGLQYVIDADDGRQRLANPLPKLGGWEALIGWGFIFVSLIIMSDMGKPGRMASAFAWLFAVAVLFTYGIEAFENLLILQGEPTAIPITYGTSSGE